LRSSPGEFWAELAAPKSDRFVANEHASLSEQIFNISMAKVESVVETDGMADNIGRESVAFIGIHSPILPISVG